MPPSPAADAGDVRVADPGAKPPPQRVGSRPAWLTERLVRATVAFASATVLGFLVSAVHGPGPLALIFFLIAAAALLYGLLDSAIEIAKIPWLDQTVKASGAIAVVFALYWVFFPPTVVEIALDLRYDGNDSRPLPDCTRVKVGNGPRDREGDLYKLQLQRNGGSGALTKLCRNETSEKEVRVLTFDLEDTSTGLGDSRPTLILRINQRVINFDERAPPGGAGVVDR